MCFIKEISFLGQRITFCPSPHKEIKAMQQKGWSSKREGQVLRRRRTYIFHIYWSFLKDLFKIFSGPGRHFSTHVQPLDHVHNESGIVSWKNEHLIWDLKMPVAIIVWQSIWRRYFFLLDLRDLINNFTF